MKLSIWAKQQGISYRTAWRWFKDGKLPVSAEQTSSGTILVKEESLEYKTKWYGSKLIIAPRYFPSSKMCSECKCCVKELSLSTRTWQCENCLCNHDRDINAARNLLNYGTESSSGIYACGDTSNGARKKLASYVPLKQEANNGIFVHKL